ncbi:MAG TPA: EamA family transporter RarD [Opitutaceae bacterium]|nr:EamA family transporter RarD [Opitutaceae bacterium]
MSTARQPAPPAPASSRTARDRRGRAGGLTAALACFTAWGLLPVYWKQIPNVPAVEMVAHRVVWSLLFVAVLLTLQRRWAEIRRQWTAHTLEWAAFSGAAVTVNWVLYIWAVTADRVVDTSLGYFLMPLVNLLVGLMFFRERLRLLQWLAVAIAAAGLAQTLVAQAGMPWVALGLCGSFGLYGALRKNSHLDSLPGLFFETLAMAPLAVIWLVWRSLAGAAAFGAHDLRASGFLIGAGVVTAVPLLWFSHAARRLPLSTVGFIQYLSPSLSFILGTALYHEPVAPARLISFACVWVALAVFTAEALWQRRRALAPVAVAPLAPETDG